MYHLSLDHRHQVQPLFLQSVPPSPQSFAALPFITELVLKLSPTLCLKPRGPKLQHPGSSRVDHDVIIYRCPRRQLTFFVWHSDNCPGHVHDYQPQGHQHGLDIFHSIPVVTLLFPSASPSRSQFEILSRTSSETMFFEFLIPPRSGSRLSGSLTASGSFLSESPCNLSLRSVVLMTPRHIM